MQYPMLVVKLYLHMNVHMYAWLLLISCQGSLSIWAQVRVSCSIQMQVAQWQDLVKGCAICFSACEFVRMCLCMYCVPIRFHSHMYIPAHGHMQDTCTHMHPHAPLYWEFVITPLFLCHGIPHVYIIYLLHYITLYYFTLHYIYISILCIIYITFTLVYCNLHCINNYVLNVLSRSCSHYAYSEYSASCYIILIYYSSICLYKFKHGCTHS